MTQGMHNLNGWHQISCEQSELIRSEPGTVPFSSLTDMDGEYGEPIIYTEWGNKQDDVETLRDYRWPKSERTCEHWVPDREGGE